MSKNYHVWVDGRDNGHHIDAESPELACEIFLKEIERDNSIERLDNDQIIISDGVSEWIFKIKVKTTYKVSKTLVATTPAWVEDNSGCCYYMTDEK